MGQSRHVAALLDRNHRSHGLNHWANFASGSCAADTNGEAAPPQPATAAVSRCPLSPFRANLARWRRDVPQDSVRGKMALRT